MKVRYEEDGGVWKCYVQIGCIRYKGYGSTKEEAYIAMMDHKEDLMERISVDYH